MKEKEELGLPDDITPATMGEPRDLVIISIPKAGKGTIFGKFTEQYKDSLVLDLEKGGYDYIPARKLTTYVEQDTSRWESFQNYIKYRNMLMANKGKYKYLLVDGLSDLDDLSEIGGTLAYMNSIIGKNFNRPKLANNAYGDQYKFEDPEFASVLTLPEGYGYQHTRIWFLQQVEIFKQIAPYRIWAAHLADKYIKDNGKEQVIGSELALTGQLKRIFASKVTTMAKLTVDGDERWLNFDVQNDSIVAGSRHPSLSGKMLISRKDKGGNIVTFWESIYK
jgi:hypothetical protein